MASPQLKGEKTAAEAWERFRRAWNLVLRLALIEDGKLFRAKYEAVLLMSLRLTFPGKETSDNFVQFMMDASGKKAFGICMKALWYVQETFTEEENGRCNIFEKEREADSTTINHREHVVLAWMLSGPGVLHPGKTIDHAVDNVAAEGMTNSQRYWSVKDEQAGASIGFQELLLQQTASSSRVASIANFTDYFTRDKFDLDADKMLAYFGDWHQASQVEATAWQAGLASLGWLRLKPEEPQRVWYENTLEWFDWLQEVHPESLHAVALQGRAHPDQDSAG